MKSLSAPPFFSQQNTDQPAAALVDDPLQGLGELGAGRLGHMLQLGVDALSHQLVEGLAEHIGLPDAGGVLVELTEHVPHQILGLLLGAHDGTDLGLDVGADHVDGGS